MGENKSYRKDFLRLGQRVWLVVFFLSTLVMPGNSGASLRIGDTLPSITLSGLSGTSIRVPDNFRGKVIILHFWMIGCSSCREEMPALDGLYRTYRNKGLEILAVNVGQRKESVKPFASELKVSYPLLLDTDRKNAGLYGVTDVPRTYVIDRGCVVRYKIFGGAPPELLKKLVLSLL